jgi:hypothetical protein
MNDKCEAYTRNTVGRREVRTFPRRYSPVRAAKQSATVLTSRKPAQGNLYGEISEGLPGSESMACSERSVRNLGDPSVSSLEVGSFNRKESD